MASLSHVLVRENSLWCIIRSSPFLPWNWLLLDVGFFSSILPAVNRASYGIVLRGNEFKSSSALDRLVGSSWSSARCLSQLADSLPPFQWLLSTPSFLPCGVGSPQWRQHTLNQHLGPCVKTFMDQTPCCFSSAFCFLNFPDSPELWGFCVWPLAGWGLEEPGNTNQRATGMEPECFIWPHSHRSLVLRWGLRAWRVAQ